MKNKEKEVLETKVDETEKISQETINDTAKKIIEAHEKKETEIETKIEEVDPTIELNETINTQVAKLKEQEDLISKLSSIITNGTQTGEKVNEPANDTKVDYTKNVAKDILGLK